MGSGDVSVLAGTHVIGAKAKRLLLPNIYVRDLEAVRDETQCARYYQEVSEVRETGHDHARLTSQPKSLVQSGMAPLASEIQGSKPFSK